MHIKYPRDRLEGLQPAVLSRVHYDVGAVAPAIRDRSQDLQQSLGQKVDIVWSLG